MASPHRTSTASPFGSSLTEQFQRERALQDRISSIVSEGRPASAPGNRSPARSRSLSDSPKPALSPAPALRESKGTRDDFSLGPPSNSAAVASRGGGEGGGGHNAVFDNPPSTPTRPLLPMRGLSLQMPTTATNPTAAVLKHVPLSPKLDASTSFPASVLPRRSRGLDFSRACTNLHHSTLADDSTESSPTVGNRNGMAIPQRRSIGGSGSLFETGASWANGGNGERTQMSGSVSSVNMLDSSSDSDSDDDDLMDQGDAEDAIFTTPQVNKFGNGGSNLFGTGIMNSPGSEWKNSQPATAASLMSYQRARLRHGRSRHSSSSASANSSRPSPGTLSPPLVKSIENPGGNNFSRELARKDIQSRRESLSLGTSDMMLSDLSDDEGRQLGMGSGPGANGSGVAAAEGPRGVIRRAVTRRSNLLPKTKNFARIRAALLEECAPVEGEEKREAEVIRQVRESEPVIPSSPIHPPAAFLADSDNSPEDDMMSTDGADSQPLAKPMFKEHASRNSGGLDFWNQFDERYRTPPPPLRNRQSSSNISEDANMEASNTPAPTAQHQQQSIPDWMKYDRSRSRSSTPHAPNGPAADIRTVNNKRRRDDDFDPNLFKRRAVSPGMSMQSSPVVPQSPSREAQAWGQPPKTSHGHAAGERANSGGNERNIAGLPKRVGLQGMTETNDGLMNMSIE